MVKLVHCSCDQWMYIFLLLRFGRIFACPPRSEQMEPMNHAGSPPLPHLRQLLALLRRWWVQMQNAVSADPAPGHSILLFNWHTLLLCEGSSCMQCHVTHCCSSKAQQGAAERCSSASGDLVSFRYTLFWPLLQYVYEGWKCKQRCMTELSGGEIIII